MTTLPRAAIILISSFAFVTTHAAIAGEAQPSKTPSSEGTQIVGKHAIMMNKPVGGPSAGMANGPLIGNGDLGVMQSGSAEHLTFYVGKNDFWCIRTQSVIAVGQVRIATPALQGASFKTMMDMQLAEIRGEYARGDVALASRGWVDANRDLLCIELVNKGTRPLAMAVQSTKGGDGAVKPANVRDNNTPVQVGCEQYGGGRWFFSGEMADVSVLDRALPEEEIAKLAQAERKDVKVFDGKTRQPLAAPAISKALTISAWIKVAKRSREADYILSKGEWNQAYSLGLSGGHVRFAIGGFFLQCDEQVPLNRWVHVAAIFDDKHMAVFIDGKVRASSEAAADLGAAFLYAPDAPNPAGRRIGLATRVVGNTDAREFALEPGKTAVVATAILSDLDVKGQDPLAEAKSLVAALTQDKLTEQIAAHRQWWRDFWSRSFIEIPDKVIEQHWYYSWYTVGSCSRAGKVAPGLWGNWITTDAPSWHGDFHLNYNFQAPFYGLYSANHPETTLPFYDAMNQSIPRGQRIAKEHGWKGSHLPVSIGPWGMCPEGDKADWGQRSNAAYAALPFIWHWQYTQDKEWLKNTGYPYLRETALFWEDYLKFENGRYVIYNDSIHEGSGPDVNGLLSLGLVRTLFKNMVSMSEVLGVDADRRAKWKDICEHVSPFPTQERNGKTVFRYTEKGTAWWNDNTLGIQHIFPAGAIGLDSDPKLLEISRNMVDAMQRWTDGNGFSSWYSACARIGYDPKRILGGLRHECDMHSAPNMLLQYGGGGIENCSGFLAINEMLLQSHEGVIRLFPCWPRELDARFGTLRAVGAFLVSADLKGGVISGVKICSEKGLACTVVNPWPDKKVQVVRNGTSAETVAGERFTLKTSVNETLELGPGTSLGAAAETDSFPVRGLAEVAHANVELRGGFWGPRLKTHHEVTIPHALDCLEKDGHVTNFDKAAGVFDGPLQGHHAFDSDLYKALEGAVYSLQHCDDSRLRQRVDGILDRILAAQQKDGFLISCFIVQRQDKRWDDLRLEHQMYNAGHFFEMAVAHAQLTGDPKGLSAAKRFADHIDGLFGPGKRYDVDGHQEIELALVKLYRATGERRYLELARFLLDERGYAHGTQRKPFDPKAVIAPVKPEGKLTPEQQREFWHAQLRLRNGRMQDHKPVVDQQEAVGHAVRAGYMYAAMADIVRFMEAPGYERALDHLWDDVVGRKMYLTGGIGTGQYDDEGFGDPYRLPNESAYCESCAAIAHVLWQHRMNLLKAQAKYADVMELALYNGALAGISISGDRFCYQNPLASKGSERSLWIGLACCPTNLTRITPQVGGLAYASGKRQVYVNLYVAGEASLKMDDGMTVTLTQQTDYPWDGRVRLTVTRDQTSEFTLCLRIPGWALGRPVPSDLYRFADPKVPPVGLKVNSQTVDPSTSADGYVHLQRRWKAGDVVELDLPMPAHRVYAHEKVQDDQNKVALMRGPIIYCLEAVDHPGVDLFHLVLPRETALRTEHHAELLGGVTVLQGKARADGQRPVALTAVPYYAWANREKGAMTVWIDEPPSSPGLR